METIANWLWQGTALAIAATMLIHASKRISATTRYRLWWGTLVMVLCLPAAPSLALLLQSLLVADVPGGVAPASLPVFSAGAAAGPRTLTLPAIPGPLLAASALAWAGWLGVSAVRAAHGIRHLRGARAMAQPFPTARAARLSNWIALRDRGRRCTLAVSESVGAAAVLGPSSPLIAIAPHLLSELTDAELDRIVVHEWAHVQRRDDLARLVQVVVRAVAGLHPAVWWIDRRLQLEREAACDDWAVTLTGSARGYAACLTKLAALRITPADPSFAPTAIGSSDLAKRVLRLLDARRSRALSGRALATSLLGASLVAVTSTVASFAVVVNAAAVAPGGALDSPSPALHASAAIAHAAAVAPPAAPARLQAGTTVRRDAPAEARTGPKTIDDPKPATAAPQAPAPTGSGFTVHGPTPPVHGLTPDQIMLGVSVDVPEPATTPASAQPATPWAAAADAGVGVGRGSRKAAVATAGFFSKLGKSIARSF